jgi:hypothetical protein
METLKNVLFKYLPNDAHYRFDEELRLPRRSAPRNDDGGESHRPRAKRRPPHPVIARNVSALLSRHCEERSDEAIQALTRPTTTKSTHKKTRNRKQTNNKINIKTYAQ